MKILLSIKPQFVDKILRGEKLYEYRRSLPKRKDLTRIVVYASSPVCKLVGEIEIDEYVADNIDVIWEKTKLQSGLTHVEYLKYFHDRNEASAIKIKRFIAYKTPKSLKDTYPTKVAPQSFCYVEENK